MAETALGPAQVVSDEGKGAIPRIAAAEVTGEPKLLWIHTRISLGVGVRI
jgi:hypothetical protein